MRVAFHEYGAILRDLRGTRALRARLGFLLGPPGWAPDGTSEHVPATAQATSSRLRQPATEHAR